MSFAPEGQTYQYPQQHVPHYQPYVLVPSNGMAVTAMILGIVGIVIGIWSPIPILGLFAAIFGFVPAALGVVFGHIGLSRARQLNGIGRAQAIAGLVTGYATVAIILLVTVFWIIAMMASAVSDASSY